MPKIAGTLRKLVIEGISYDVHGDTNVTETITGFENDRLPTSGVSMRKMTKRVTKREGIIVASDANEREQLKAFAESIDDLTFSYTNASGDQYKCQGSMEIENNESEENRTTLQIHPANDWTPVIA